MPQRVPAEAWKYKVGNRSALEWVLDQYKEKKPSDPTILEKFNTYKFADYKEQVIDLLKRVCTVSVETMKIIGEMEKIKSAGRVSKKVRTYCIIFAGAILRLVLERHCFNCALRQFAPLSHLIHWHIRCGSD